jgi:hypothetical protein
LAAAPIFWVSSTRGFLAAFGLAADFGFAGLAGGFGPGLELIYPAFDVDYPLLTGEEGMGRAGDMDFNERVFHTVKRNSLIGRYR